jgi:hypothetical protein
MMLEQQKHERRYTQIHDKLSISMLDTHDSQSQDHILTKVVEEDKIPTTTKEQHCFNKSATASGFKQGIDMLQHRQMLMQCEARLENLIIEHQINIQDLQDTYGNEKELMEIQYQQQLHQEQDEKSQITHRLIHAEEKVCDLLAESDISNKRLSHAEESAKKADKKCSIIKKEAHSKLAELKNVKYIYYPCYYYFN